jgi:hypothetical protein
MMLASKSLLISLVFFSAASLVHAAPVNVTYTISGGSGNYTLDFSFTNNELGTDQNIYFLGVYLNPSLGLSSVVRSPSSYDPTVFPTYSVGGLGGSSIEYDDVWFDPSISNLAPGQSISGFDVQVASAAAPLAVPWFAFSTGTLPYLGTGSFTNDPDNPGFEGVAAPEPATWMLLGISLCGFIICRLTRVRLDS